jgi:N-acetylglucosaminyl-diphospho-decaprenol L-rhamnosyltransferase
MTRGETLSDDPALVSVVLVTYNSASVILDAIQSVDDGAEVIVVDNASTDNTLDVLRETDVQVIANPSNVGFGSACNIGAALSKRPFLFFLNPDATLHQGAIVRLIQAAREHVDCAAFNPRILSPDGRNMLRGKSRLLPPELNKIVSIRLQADAMVEMLLGAAIFCRRTDYEVVGGFDEKLFLYCEDDDLAIRWRKAGRRLRYVHDAVVEHIGDASSQPSLEMTEFKSYHLMKASRYAMRKHGRPFNRPYMTVQSALKLTLSVVTFDRPQAARWRGSIKALLEPES